ncbi:Ubiquitin carboxyl-terminal hydrolase [Quillaja saponaria]|uniref:Ubiquitin carboxyl-terminal hydrolase n=1 Tax=Quillaja saponaria TaxID=32244 RepID=A0AAD7VLA2_QUISA|nr:Ubiquitin carboxyl-terminal hydrolase [Quillaja saponaria]
MGDSLLMGTEAVNQSDGVSKFLAGSSDGSAFLSRTINFHPARKPFKGFSSGFGDFKLETLNPCSSSDRQRLCSNPVQSTLGATKLVGSEFLENGLDPELSFGITFRRIGAGLENLGNTCFLNSVLQCLTYTEPLAAYLQSGKHKNSCRIAGFCALCAIQNHVSRALQSTGRILVPKDLVSNLRCISRTFRNARQEDAHEYMVNLLESMHKCCLPSGVPSESSSAYEKSLVHKIFGGRLRSQVKCQQCAYCSDKFDPFLDLSLEIVKADSLHRALVNFTTAELLDGGERQYQCQKCKQKVRALKQLTVHKAPFVLTIHLKRFHSHDPGRKINKKVQFGCTLDLRPFFSGSNEEDLKYTLYGVLVHAGFGTHSGHYYCYVRTSNGMWYTLDDNRVHHVSEREVLNQQAYMLFYVRDRKNIVPRKPVDVAQKENMKVNVNGSRSSSTLNQGVKELVKNAPTEDRFNGVVSSTGETQKDTLNVDSSMAFLSKNVSVSEPSSQAPLPKGSQEVLPVPDSKVIESVLPSGPSEKTCSRPQTLKKLIASAGDIIDDGNAKVNYKKDSTILVSSSNAPSDIQNYSTDHARDNAAKKVKSQKISDVAAPGDSCEKISNADDLIGALAEPSSKHTEAGGRKGDSLCEKAGDDQKQAEDLLKVSSSSVMTTGSMDMEGLYCKHGKKLKKNVLKYQVPHMQLSSNILLMMSLGLRKKKKQKGGKQRRLDKNQNQECLSYKDFFSSDTGPSTSKKICILSLGETHSQRRVPKSGPKAGVINMASLNSNSDSLTEKVDGEFRKGMDESSAVLATAKQLENSSQCSFVLNKHDVRKPDGALDSKRDKIYTNDSMSMLTQGLDDTVVARWDDLELPPSRVLESNGDETVSIGYTGDEWDEEYDRGKRKKLRLFKHSFGGPNPFQEIAAKKTKFKKAKLDQSSSGNRPFRI